MPLTSGQFVISILLFLVLFFGMGFILNMLLKTTWLPGALFYPIIVVLIVSDLPFWSYVTSPIQSIQDLGLQFTQLLVVDYIILLMGLLGALASGFTIQTLRAKGYRMF